MVKNLLANAGDERDPLSERSPIIENGILLQFLPGESHGQRYLAGCSPWGHKESDITE